MNKYILVILKTMAKNPNIRKTETWTESKTQIVSILTRKIQKLKVDHHFMNMDVNELHMGIHSTLSFQQNIFPDKYDGLYYLLLE
jgi:hypothetical protein